MNATQMPMLGANLQKIASNMALTENTAYAKGEEPTIEAKSGIHVEIRDGASMQSQTDNVRNSLANDGSIEQKDYTTENTGIPTNSLLINKLQADRF